MSLRIPAFRNRWRLGRLDEPLEFRLRHVRQELRRGGEMIQSITVFEIGDRRIVQVQGEQTCRQYRRTEDGGLEMREIRGPDHNIWEEWTRVPWLYLVWLRFRRRKWDLILRPLGI